MYATSYTNTSTVLVAAGMADHLSSGGGSRRCDPEWINVAAGRGGAVSVGVIRLMLKTDRLMRH